MPRKRTTNREVNRIDHKRSRAAERQALEGGHARVVHGSWSSSVPQPPLLDEESRRYPGRKKGCKRNRKGGGKHEPILRTASQRAKHTMEINGRRWFWGSTYVCKHCGKAMWGVKPPELPPRTEKTPDHWTANNIHRRLAGQPCLCETCNPR